MVLANSGVFLQCLIIYLVRIGDRLKKLLSVYLLPVLTQIFVFFFIKYGLLRFFKVSMRFSDLFSFVFLFVNRI